MMQSNRRGTVAETALLLAPAVLFFCRAAGMPSVGITCGALLLFSLFWRRAWSFSEQNVITVLAAALLLTVIGSRIFPPASDRFTFLAAMLYPEIVCPFLLYLAVLFTLFRRPAPALGMSAAAALAVLAFCGELACFQMIGEWIPVRVPSEGRLLYKLYPAAVILTFLFGFRNLRRTCRCGRSGLREVWVLLTWAAVGTAAWGLVMSRNFWQEQLQAMENWIFRNDPVTYGRPRTPVFFENASADLRETLRPELRERESEIALQAIGSPAPGYLRGRGFSIYCYGGKWEPGTAFPADLPERQENGAPVYLLQTAAGTPEYGWTILPKIVHSGDFVWYPDAAAEVELSSGTASRTADGTIRVRNGASVSGYRVRAYAVNRAESPAAEPADEKSMRQIPYELSPVLREICYAVDVQRPQPLNDRTGKLLAFFQDSFLYSLTPGKPDGDPVEHFLLRSRRGHCELFASAMVLLLRQCGIPARYVTGFICNEPHCGGSIHVARMGNAHAWVEAYDRDLRQWVRLDPTPSLPAVPARDHEMLYQYWESVDLYGSEILAAIQRGHWAEAAGALLDAVCSILTDRITLAAAGMLALLTVFAVFFRRCYFRKRSRKFDAVPERRQMIRRYQWFLWKMRLCGRIPWRSAPTVQEMLERLASAPLHPPEKQTAALHFLQRYREERYRP